MASITKRGRRWLVRWRDPDGGERTRSCPDKATADVLRREVERAHALGQRWTSGEAAPPSLKEAQEAYARFRAPRKRAASLYLDELSAHKFGEWLRERRPRAARFGVDELNHANLRDYDTALRTSGLHVKTANGYTLAVRRWWAWCAAQPEYEPYLKPAPESAVLALPAAPWVPPHAPTWDECDRAIAAAERVPWLHAALVVLRFTGLRQSQAMALEWRDLDIRDRDDAWLTVRPELGKTTQERSGRVVPISPHLVDYLAGTGRRDGYVVAPSRARRMVDAAPANVAWKRSGVRRVAWERHPCHSFRYAFTSGLAAMGADHEAVERLVGHAVMGTRASYLDPRWALRLREAVDMLPAVGGGSVVGIRVAT